MCQDNFVQQKFVVEWRKRVGEGKTSAEVFFFAVFFLIFIRVDV